MKAPLETTECWLLPLWRHHIGDYSWTEQGGKDSAKEIQQAQGKEKGSAGSEEIN